MPFCPTASMLCLARDGHYAVGAFNVENMEMAQAVVAAAEAVRAPVILQTTPGTVQYAGLAMYHAMVKTLAERASVPVALHLDHGSSFALAAEALAVGYPSIMIDGSKHPLDDNIRLTREVVRMCAPCGVSVEGELGRVGGKEDDLSCEDAGYTDPDEAEQFVRATGVTALAVGVGTAHGVYATPPALRIELVETLRRRIDTPLVLHGASGLSDDVVRACIARGITKVNFATELRIAYTKAVRDTLAADEKAFDPKAFGKPARKAVQALVEERMRVCGCAGKA